MAKRILAFTMPVPASGGGLKAAQLKLQDTTTMVITTIVVEVSDEDAANLAEWTAAICLEDNTIEGCPV